MTSSTYHQPTAAELRSGQPLRALIEEQLGAWAPNHMSDGRVESYADWIDQALEDMPLPDGRRLTCGPDEASEPYTTIKRIAQRVAAEHR